MELKERKVKYIEFNDYVVEVEYDYVEENVLNFYIHNKRIGDKMFMFGLDNKDVACEKEAIDIINANIDEYISMYQMEFEEE